MPRQIARTEFSLCTQEFSGAGFCPCFCQCFLKLENWRKSSFLNRSISISCFIFKNFYYYRAWRR